jgi:hypothetical protein
MGFENFKEPKGSSLQIKHTYYIIDSNGDIDFEIRSETSVSIRSSSSNTFYILAKKKNGNFYSYWQFNYGENVDYKKLKEDVIKILDDSVKPQSSTIKN